jgi:hypothetical protein
MYRALPCLHMADGIARGGSAGLKTRAGGLAGGRLIAEAGAQSTPPRQRRAGLKTPR